jgi:hypothetical protein
MSAQNTTDATVQDPPHPEFHSSGETGSAEPPGGGLVVPGSFHDYPKGLQVLIIFFSSFTVSACFSEGMCYFFPPEEEVSVYRATPAATPVNPWPDERGFNTYDYRTGPNGELIEVNLDGVPVPQTATCQCNDPHCKFPIPPVTTQPPGDQSSVGRRLAGIVFTAFCSYQLYSLWRKYYPAAPVPNAATNQAHECPPGCVACANRGTAPVTLRMIPSLIATGTYTFFKTKFQSAPKLNSVQIDSSRTGEINATAVESISRGIVPAHRCADFESQASRASHQLRRLNVKNEVPTVQELTQIATVMYCTPLSKSVNGVVEHTLESTREELHPPRCTSVRVVDLCNPATCQSGSVASTDNVFADYTTTVPGGDLKWSECAILSSLEGQDVASLSMLLTSCTTLVLLSTDNSISSHSPSGDRSTVVSYDGENAVQRVSHPFRKPSESTQLMTTLGDYEFLLVHATQTSDVCGTALTSPVTYRFHVLMTSVGSGQVVTCFHLVDIAHGNSSKALGNEHPLTTLRHFGYPSPFANVYNWLFTTSVRVVLRETGALKKVTHKGVHRPGGSVLFTQRVTHHNAPHIKMVYYSGKGATPVDCIIQSDLYEIMRDCAPRTSTSTALTTIRRDYDSVAAFEKGMSIHGPGLPGCFIFKTDLIRMVDEASRESGLKIGPSYAGDFREPVPAPCAHREETLVKCKRSYVICDIGAFAFSNSLNYAEISTSVVLRLESAKQLWRSMKPTERAVWVNSDFFKRMRRICVHYGRALTARPGGMPTDMGVHTIPSPAMRVPLKDDSVIFERAKYNGKLATSEANCICAVTHAEFERFNDPRSKEFLRYDPDLNEFIGFKNKGMVKNEPGSMKIDPVHDDDTICERLLSVNCGPIQHWSARIAHEFMDATKRHDGGQGGGKTSQEVFERICECVDFPQRTTRYVHINTSKPFRQSIVESNPFEGHDLDYVYRFVKIDGTLDLQNERPLRNCTDAVGRQYLDTVMSDDCIAELNESFYPELNADQRNSSSGLALCVDYSMYDSAQTNLVAGSVQGFIYKAFFEPEAAEMASHINFTERNQEIEFAAHLQAKAIKAVKYVKCLITGNNGSGGSSTSSNNWQLNKACAMVSYELYLEKILDTIDNHTIKSIQERVLCCPEDDDANDADKELLAKVAMHRLFVFETACNMCADLSTCVGDDGVHIMLPMDIMTRSATELFMTLKRECPCFPFTDVAGKGLIMQVNFLATEMYFDVHSIVAADHSDPGTGKYQTNGNKSARLVTYRPDIRRRMRKMSYSNTNQRPFLSKGMGAFVQTCQQGGTVSGVHELMCLYHIIDCSTQYGDAADSAVSFAALIDRDRNTAKRMLHYDLFSNKDRDLISMHEALTKTVIATCAEGTEAGDKPLHQTDGTFERNSRYEDVIFPGDLDVSPIVAWFHTVVKPMQRQYGLCKVPYHILNMWLDTVPKVFTEQEEALKRLGVGMRISTFDTEGKVIDTTEPTGMKDVINLVPIDSAKPSASAARSIPPVPTPDKEIPGPGNGGKDAAASKDKRDKRTISKPVTNSDKSVKAKTAVERILKAKSKGSSSSSSQAQSPDPFPAPPSGSRLERNPSTTNPKHPGFVPFAMVAGEGAHDPGILDAAAELKDQSPPGPRRFSSGGVDYPAWCYSGGASPEFATHDNSESDGSPLSHSRWPDTRQAIAEHFMANYHTQFSNNNSPSAPPDIAATGISEPADMSGGDRVASYQQMPHNYNEPAASTEAFVPPPYPPSLEDFAVEASPSLLK